MADWQAGRQLPLRRIHIKFHGNLMARHCRRRLLLFGDKLYAQQKKKEKTAY